jgi:outer membrane protein TolC
MNKMFEQRAKNKEQRIMNNMEKYKIQKIVRAIFLLLTFITASNCASSQNADTSKYSKGDSLTLNQLIKQVVETHPSIKEAEEALNIADSKIGLAKAGYLPNIGIDGNYTMIGPVPSITFGGMALKMAPANNVNAALDYNQSVYDFGKTKNEVNMANENKNLSKLSIEQLKQKMSIAAISNFYILLYIQDAIEIKGEELKTLQSHLEYVKKKSETGSATQYEILSTQVRISNIESQKIDLETNRKVQLSFINSLLGQPQNTYLNVKKELSGNLPDMIPDSLISFALSHRDEMKFAREKSAIAELQYKVTHAQDNPSINFFATGGYKNGYFSPNLLQPGQNFAWNFVAGIDLKVPLFDANRKKNNLLIAKSGIQDCNYEVEITTRNISTEIIQSDAEVDASDKKIKQFELQLKQAEKALGLAEVNYKAGVITNLDLLDATTTVSESRLMLLKSKIDHIANIFKLKNAIGERLY